MRDGARERQFLRVIAGQKARSAVFAPEVPAIPLRMANASLSEMAGTRPAMTIESARNRAPYALAANCSTLLAAPVAALGA
jgi:hypothetical protein